MEAGSLLGRKLGNLDRLLAGTLACLHLVGFDALRASGHENFQCFLDLMNEARLIEMSCKKHQRLREKLLSI